MSKLGYWSIHQYHRLSVEEWVEEWVGWPAMLDLVRLAREEFGSREEAFLTTLFLTGGRVSEALPLKRENFWIHRKEGVIIVKGMPLLKRYRKIEEYVDEEGKRRWKTEPLFKRRKPFPILLEEPLTPILLKWLEKHPSGLLFPSPYRTGKPLTRFWAYRMIRRLDQEIPHELRRRLNLIQWEPGKRANRLHLWPHWFRAQRASCLVEEYDFRLHHLLEYFSWENLETARRYARRGWRGLAELMRGIRIPDLEEAE